MTFANSQNSQHIDNESRLYRLVWRWHFYAGIFCIPFILALSISGAIYLFKPQIDIWVERPLYSTQTDTARHSPSEIIYAALEALPESKFLSLRLPKTDREAVVVNVIDRGKRTLVYVDAYNLQPLKIIGHRDQFIREVRNFHGELLAGDIGSILVELAGSWAIVLIITGLYLWWPRSGMLLAGTLYPRVRQQRSVFWRDMHAVIGAWLSVALLFLLISGLPWSTVWGGAFKEIRKSIGGFSSQEWTLTASEESLRWTRSAVSDVNLTPEILVTARALNFASPAELAVFDSDRWQLTSNHQNRALRATALLDGETGEVQNVTYFSERPLIDRVIGIGISIHEGHYFGWANQLLGLIVSLGAVGLSVTGSILWWRRKPLHRLGAPKPVPDMRMGRVVGGILLGLALFLPLLAFSIIILLLLEWMVFSRLKSISEWLGLT